MTTIIPVILCGGAGSRLWPASREAYPKQLFAFGGGQSLLQDTLRRVTGEGYGRPVIITGNDYRFLVAEQMRALGVEGDVLLEPMRRDSCAAVLAATAFVARRDKDAVILMLAADHAIPDKAAFDAHVRRAAKGAAAGRIVTFGIRPSSPATGYGYIRPGDALPGVDGVHAIQAFVEKPDQPTAERYIAEGCLWNSGNFMFAASTLLGEAAALAPDIHGPATRAVEKGKADLDFFRLEPEAFAAATPKSLDYAIMEKTKLAAVVPSDFAWSDIGGWAAVWELADKDPYGNAAVGDGVFHKSRGSYVHSPHHLTAVVGLDDVVVVSTRDAVLVTSKQRSEEIKGLVAALAAKGRKEVAEHVRSYRPWGDYEQIDMGRRYQVKRITVKPGGKLSLQSHFHRAEHWVVVTGTAKVTVDDKIHLLGENESVYIPLGAVHRMENPGQIPLELIEVQSGSYLGEDDIVRYEDIYNRS